MRYLLYARKSSESEEKQAQSIDDQLKELRALATQRGLNVVGEFTEAKSAKAPGCRPVFAEMVSRIQSGEADSILCWHVNRLFRNPVDFGTISWMLQTGALREIHTPHQVYRSGDNVLLLSVENGMANQYILDLRKAVVRGLNSKVEKGWYPHKAPEGYRNVEGVIESDAERFALIRKAWDLMLTGHYTPPQVLKIMTNEWGYTTKKLKKVGGKPLTRSSIYNLFSNIFYTGHFQRNGEVFKGRHVPMITLEEFYRVKGFLHKRTQVRPRTHQFVYTGLMECGHCGCAIVGDLKKQTLADGSKKTYMYYYCSNARRNCTRRGISEEDVERQILNLLEAIQIPPQLRELGMQVIEDWKAVESKTTEQTQATIAREIDQLEQKRAKLLDLKLGELLTDAEYIEQKTRVTEDLSNLRQRHQMVQEQAELLGDNMENILTLATYGMDMFDGGEPALRALIAKTLGIRYVLVNKRLSVEMNPVFTPLCEMQNAAIIRSESLQNGDLSPMRPLWWSIVDAIRNALREHQVKICKFL